MRRWMLVALLTIGVIALWSMGPPTRAGDVPGESCMDCHEEAFIADFPNTSHGRLADGGWFGAAQACASCHGPVEQHMEESDPALIRSFPGEPAADSKLCLSCHSSASHMGAWAAGEHAMAGVSCLDCHSIHGGGEFENRVREDALGKHARGVSPRTCFRCHENVRSEMRLPSHHPVAEGEMTCVDCHDPHGANPGLLKTALRTNDLCFECHASKQGPFIFQHDPVEEDCMICHRPHGAVADNLLAQTEPFLCLQCHEGHFHAGVNSPEGDHTIRGVTYANPNGAQSSKFSMLTKCSQCHASVHGSDNPSQSVTSQGESLTR